MKWSNIILLASGATALRPVYMEPTLTKRQSVSQVVDDLGTISASVVALDTGIKGINNANQEGSLITLSQAVVSAINKAQGDAAQLPNGAITDVNTVLTPVENLINAVTTAVNDLDAKQPLIASLSLCGPVLTQINDLSGATTNLINTLIPKLSTELRDAGRQLANQITAQLEKAASTYQSCAATSPSPTTSTPVITTTTTSTGTTSTGTGTTSTGTETTSTATTTVSIGPATGTTVITSTSGTLTTIVTSTSAPGSFTSTPTTAPGLTTSPISTAPGETSPAGTTPGVPGPTTTGTGATSPSPSSTLVPAENIAATFSSSVNGLLAAVVALLAVAA